MTDSLIRHKLLDPVHFGVFKENGLKINEVVKLYGKENITFASNYNNVNYINYYVNDDLEEEIVDWDQADAVYLLADRAKTSKTKYFCYSFSNKYHAPMFLEVIRKYYPYKVSEMSTRFTCFYLFSRSSKRQINSTFYNRKIVDSTGDNSEFKAEIKLLVGEIPFPKDKNEYYLFSCKGVLIDSVPFHLVVTIERDGQPLIEGKDPKVYYGYDQSRIGEFGKPQEFFTAFDLPDDLKPTDILKAYCWNPEKGKVKISAVRLSHVVN
jgi:hypothetical protein